MLRKLDHDCGAKVANIRLLTTAVRFHLGEVLKSHQLIIRALETYLDSHGALLPSLPVLLIYLHRNVHDSALLRFDEVPAGLIS